MLTIPELFDLAVRHHQRGDLRQAELLYREILRADPSHGTAQTKLGLALQATGRAQEGLACFKQAVRINPFEAYTHNNLGAALASQGQLSEAVECYRQALRIDPNHADAHSNLGNALKELGQLGEAINCARQALRINPNHADAFSNLGNALKDQGQLAEAIICFRQALRLRPNYANAHNNLGLALYGQNQIPEAITCYQRALQLNPNYAQAYDNLGAALVAAGQLNEAVACFRQALRINPGFANAHNNLGNVLVLQRHLDEAAERFQNALQVDPGHKVALWNRSLLRLLQGDFEGGWPDYEQRWAQPGNVPPVFSQPRWDGSPLDGKTILLHAEQGLGDTIQFIRFAPLIKQSGGRVFLQCPVELVGIMQSCPGIDQVVPMGFPLPPFDVQLPLMSLPLVLETTLDTVPASIPYLSADPALIERWRQELSNFSGFKIGIVWQGNPRFERLDCRASDQRRSIPLAQFEPLAGLLGVRLFSLQKGYGTEQLAQWQARWGIIDLCDRLTDFTDTAAVMMNLDLIISADTSPVHLAGALGRPVWAVLPFSGCWRWLLDRSDSPWYPTLRLFRQRTFGDWADLFEQVATALRDLVATRTGR